MRRGPCDPSGGARFATVAILTLALGIGANAAIFTVVNGVLLRALPFRDIDRVVRVYSSNKTETKGNHSAAAFLDLGARNHSLEALAGYRQDLVAVTAGGQSPSSSRPRMRPRSSGRRNARGTGTAALRGSHGQAARPQPRRLARPVS
jgi:hypothetical protein